jgi:hypothetical protein
MIMKQQKTPLIMNIQKNLLQPRIFQMKEKPHFLKILFSIIMLIQILNPINMRIQRRSEQLIKYFHSDEMDKTRTRGSSRAEAIFSHASIEPTFLLKQLDINNGKKK